MSTTSGSPSIKQLAGPDYSSQDGDEGRLGMTYCMRSSFDVW